MTRNLSWKSIFLVHREDAEERQRSMVDTWPRGLGVRLKPTESTHPGSHCRHMVCKAVRLPVLGARMGPSSVFLHREEVVMQHRGVTAGTEVHGCLERLADSSVRRKFSLLDLETLYPSGMSP